MIERLIDRNDISGAKLLLEEVLNKNISFKPEDILFCLKSGHPQLEFLAIKIIKKFPFRFNKEQLKRIFEFNEEELNSFLSNTPIYFQFPIVNAKEGKLANGVAVEIDSNRIISNKQNIANIPLLKKGCVVFFDSSFEGNSFQLPLLMALTLKKQPNNLLFTGAVRDDGTISASMVKEKREIAEKYGKTLISQGNLMELSEILRKNRIKIPFFISTDGSEIDLDKLARAVKTNIGIINQLASISKEELILSIPKQISLPDDWNKCIYLAIERLRKVKASIEPYIDVPTFHIALRIPSSLAIGIGASIGTGKLPIALYHYDPLKGYLNLINLIENNRVIKRKIDKFREISIVRKQSGINTERCVVGIRLASHSPEGKPLENLISNVKGDVFLIEHKAFTGNLPLDADWTEIVAELRAAVEEIHEDYSEIHMVMSVPVIIAFALGMALGNYWNINIYQFDRARDTYCKVLNLKTVPNF